MAKLQQLSKSQLMRRIESSNGIARKARDKSAKSVEALATRYLASAANGALFAYAANTGRNAGLAAGE